MTTKAIKITYWILLILFCLFALADAYGGLSQQAEGVKNLKQVGFPIYLMVFFGVLKLLGVIALLQNKYKVLKEWAFAGFFFIFLGASWARLSTNGGSFLIILPLIFVAILLALYYFWRRFDKVNAA